MRQQTSERLIQHHAHGVPVGGLRERLPGSLFGRHIGDRAGQNPFARLRLRPASLRDEPEVEDGHPPALRDENVGGLDVAVQLSVFVQRMDPVGELPQKVAEPHVIDDPVGERAVLSTAARIRILPGLRVAGRGLERLRVERRVGTLDYGLHKGDRLDILHGEKPLAALVEQLMQCHQVRMNDPGERPKLVLEQIQRSRREGG